mgnify:CR=1 FL=1
MKNIGIIGDGITCMLSALALSLHNKSILIFADQNKKTSKTSSERHFSINLLSKHMLIKLGIWDKIKSSDITEYSKITTFDQPSKSFITFDSSLISYDYLGYIIKESALIKIIENEINKNKSISFYNACDILTIENLKTKSMILLKNKKSIDLDLLIYTNHGFESNLLELDIKFIKQNYNQKALVANIKATNNGKHNHPFQVFNNEDILGVLPTDKGNYNLIWSTTETKAKKIALENNSLLLRDLNSLLEDHIGKINYSSQPKTFPFSGFHAKKYYHNRVVLIGSAAHSVHPLAGLGLNMTMSDIFILENLLAKEKLSNITTNLLKLYNSYCLFSNNKTYYAINYIKDFYESNALPKTLKHHIFNVFENNSILKYNVIKEATGIKTLSMLLEEKYYQSYQY